MILWSFTGGFTFRNKLPESRKRMSSSTGHVLLSDNFSVFNIKFLCKTKKILQIGRSAIQHGNSRFDSIIPYLPVVLVLLLHLIRSRAISWVTPTPFMSTFTCWCHVFLSRPCLVLEIATCGSCCTWPNQHRRPLCMTLLISARCNIRQMSSCLASLQGSRGVS